MFQKVGKKACILHATFSKLDFVRMTHGGVYNVRVFFKLFGFRLGMKIVQAKVYVAGRDS